MKLTLHPAARAQQRGVSPLIVDLLVRFGTIQKSGDGTEKIGRASCRERVYLAV